MFPRRAVPDDPKAGVLARAERHDGRDGHHPRDYPRAHIFYHYFQECPAIDECVAGTNAWGHVSNANTLRRGDVVVQFFHGASHTGHIWVVVTDPDHAGQYDAAESSCSSPGGVQRVQRTLQEMRARASGVLRPQFMIGRLVEVEPVVAVAVAMAAAVPALAPAPAAVAEDAWFRVGDRNACLRQHQDYQDDAHNPVIVTLRAGCEVRTLGAEGQRRLHIAATSSPLTGWVTKKFTMTVAGVVKVAATGAYLREAASLDSRWLATLSENEELQVIAERVQVEARQDGTRFQGWVSLQFLVAAVPAPALAPAPAAAAEGAWFRVGDRNACVRQHQDYQDDAHNPVIVTLRAGCQVRAVEADEGQRRLHVEATSSESKGWVTKKFTRTVAGVVKVAATGAHLREAASLDSRLLATLPENEELRVIAERVQVEARQDGTRFQGWVSLQFLGPL